MAGSSASSGTCPIPWRRCGTPSPNPARLADWWLPFDADITIDLREGGEMVFAATSGEPPPMTCTVLRVEPPVLFEHTHVRRRRHLALGARGGARGDRAPAPPARRQRRRGHRGLLDRRPAHLAVPPRTGARRRAGAVGLGCASPSPGPATPSTAWPSPERGGRTDDPAPARPQLHALPGRVRLRRGPEPRAPLRPRRPDRPRRLGLRHRQLAQPHRARRLPGPRRLHGPRVPPEHRRRDHGPQQVRSPARPVGGPRVAGVVGRRPAVPHAGVRPHAPPAAVVQRSPTRPSTSSTPRPPTRSPRRRPPPTARTCAAAAASTTVREFLDADLVDTLHVAVAPIDLGRGERLWDSPDELLDRYHCDRVPSPSGVTHLLYWRR